MSICTMKQSVEMCALLLPKEVSEVCFEIQKKVQYVIEKTFGEHVKEVNVFVQGVKGLDR